MVYFKSAATAITIASSLSKSKAVHNCKSAVILEDFVDADHSTPPHILASRGDLNALKDSISEFGLTLRERDKNKATLLHHASDACQLPVMQFLIESGVELDAIESSGNTALHLAAMACHADAISLLLESGASCGILNYESNSPLHLAAKDMSGNSLSACLSHPIDINMKGSRNRTIAHIIAEIDNLQGCEVIKKYMMTQSNSVELFNACDDDGFTAIHLAARKNSYRMVEKALSSYKEMGKSAAALFDLIDEENSTALHVAVDSGHYEVICVLLKYGACPFILKDDMSPPLHLACSLGQLDIVKAMVQYAGVEILHRLDGYQRSPLHYSALSIHSTSIISYIMEEGQDININQQDHKGKTPLHISVSSGNLVSVKELLERGSDPFLKDKKGSNALHLAVLHDRKPIIRELLEVPNFSRLMTDLNCMGYSPIHIGLKLGLKDTVLTLMSPILAQHCPEGMHVKDCHGNNYIHLAAASGSWKLLQDFLDLPSVQKLLNNTNHCGFTPLHSAAEKGKSYCVEHLLNRGAMVHKSSKGITPLMLACAEGHVDCAKLLYKAHLFQLDWQDDLGDTALHHATRSGSPSMIQYILDLNSKILHNDHGQSFLDLITASRDEDCGLAVVNHKRWQECLDVISPVGDAPMLCLIKRMPEIAKAALDRCYKKDSSLHEKYHSEVFNFKHLLSLDNTQLQSVPEYQLSEGASPPTKQHEIVEEADHSIVKFRRTVTQKSLFLDSKKKKVSQTMEVLLTMVQYKRVKLLIHPVVLEYMKIKWRSYGLFCYILCYLFTFFNVIFLTFFVVFGSSPSLSANSSMSLLEQNVSENATFAPDSFQINTAGQVLRSLTVFCNSMALIVVIVVLVAHRFRYILSQIELLITLISIVLNYIFLLYPNPFDVKILPVGAVACFFWWLILFGTIELINIFGIYVTMFYRILRRAFQVLLVALVLLMAFALPLFLLGRNIREFSNLGLSLFSVFGYMLGEIQYSLFIENVSTYSLIIIAFVTVLAIMMSIVMANLLIGLAVGDIEEVKLNALYDSVLNKAEFLFYLDENLPKCLHRKVVNLFLSNDKSLPRFHHRKFVDASNLRLWRKRLTNMLHRKEAMVRRDDDEMSNNIDVPVDIASELVLVKQKLQEISDFMRSTQDDKDRSFDRQLRSRRFRWQMPESSSISMDSSLSDL